MLVLSSGEVFFCNLSHEELRQQRQIAFTYPYKGGALALLSKSTIVGSNFLWKTEERVNHLANVRYAHGDELTDLPGVTGIGMGKDHIILYVSNIDVEVPEQIEDVQVVKVCR